MNICTKSKLIMSFFVWLNLTHVMPYGLEKSLFFFFLHFLFIDWGSIDWMRISQREKRKREQQDHQHLLFTVTKNKNKHFFLPQYDFSLRSRERLLKLYCGKWTLELTGHFLCIIYRYSYKLKHSQLHKI